MMKHRVALELAYDGSEFFGWQRQDSSDPTIQGSLEKALLKLFQEKIDTFGAGRTDRKAHALAQVAHFDCVKNPQEFQDFKRALQSFLPNSILIKRAFLIPKDQETFHSLRSAELKTYRYLIDQGSRLCPFRRNFMHWVNPCDLKLDEKKLHKEIQCLVGEHDFKSFQNSGTEVLSTVREITKASWKRRPDGVFEMNLTGSGFLKQMVRNIVGALLEVQNESSGLTLSSILKQNTRNQPFLTAPASGLYLVEVKYSSSLDKWGDEI